MSSTPFRRSEEISETNPLLTNSIEDANAEEEGLDRPLVERRLSPAWQFWNHPPFQKRVRFDDVTDTRRYSQHTEDDESILPISNENENHKIHKHHHRPLYQKYGQWVMYMILILLGMIIGTIFSREFWKRNNELGDGPMVPPVWTLPPPTGLPRNEAYLIQAQNGAVASEDKTCSDLGLSILKDKNGSAVDSAITTTLCIGLLNGFSSGIGGGGFMVIRIPQIYNSSFELVDELISEGEEKVIAIDFRETSPDKSEKEMYGEKKAGRVAAQVGGLAVGVPGELRGLELAHQMYGKLPWEEVVMPVAELARGWRVSRELARRLRLFGQFMLSSPAWSAVYAPRGTLLVEGEYVQRINYGKTLEVIAREGAQAFYEGEIAASSIETIGSAGGVMDLDDLKGYKARAYTAIHSRFMGKEVYTTDVPSSGGILLAFLRLIEPYNIPFTGGLKSPLNVHRLLEGMKFAFGARSEITDPAPQFGGNLTRFEEFYKGDWADEKRKMLDDNRTHPIEYYGLQHDTPIDHGTTHLSVLDQWGGGASVTSTVNLIWGSHVMDPKTGIIFNDEQDDFSVPGAADAFGLWPSPWNYPQPGKRPLSSTSAAILLTPATKQSPSSIYAVIGGSGGSRIFPSILQVLLNLFSGMDISQSIEACRVHNQIVPPLTTIEVGPEGSPEEIIKDLKERGQEVGEFDVNIGISEVQAIVIENGTIWAASDSRKNGVAAGY
ncbi:gamma-glutamyltransferase [Kwoniella pini CBS 10737]|uniref:Glutathione hydrolase n=1 Tax=Kwoniella pini CBS 10737 TaxID=1296096 RepID=A0A1B9HWB6_9TREE|nr:gamma-glutamyltransferase [Kwoniella pini CBS 10737]OCF47538.1 gamma-glutamyltransferase [Kwoniella pini CBS 10737]